jgi:hypothetical protein
VNGEPRFAFATPEAVKLRRAEVNEPDGQVT